MLPSPTDTTESPPRRSSEQALNKACENCRTSKVRCLPHPGSSQCQRCAKAGRQCVFAAPAKRRQRKRTDVRVAELEREVRQLTSLLKPNSSISPAAAADVSDDSMDEEDEQAEDAESPDLPAPQSQTKAPDSTRTQHWTSEVRAPVPGPNFCSQDLLRPTENDILDRGIITETLAQELLNTYRDELVNDYPAVVIPRDWTVQDLRTRKPALFHAVMAAASHSKGAALSNKLHEEIIYYYARNFFIRGDKGVQWIQALFVTICFYTPPNHPAQMQIYQYGNIAATMALELGLASKPRRNEELPKRAVRNLQKISSAEELLENCRTVLALYIMTAGFGMRLRRPNILQFNSWMEECQIILSQSSLLEDKKIVAWLRLQRIADEAYTAFGFDDVSTSFTLSELRLQAILKIFERRMQDWRKSVPKEAWTLSLEIEYHQNMVSMWEFAMDGGRYDAPEFRNRHLTLPALDDESTVQPETLLSRSALQVNATIMCISSAQNILDCFVQIPPPRLCKAPGVCFVRAIYAIVVLLRTDYAIGTDSEGMGEYLDSSTLKVDYYLDKVVSMTEEAIGPQKCRVPSHWLWVAKERLAKWHEEHMQWRRDGKHLTNNKITKKAAISATNATKSTTDPGMPKPSSSTTTTEYTRSLSVSTLSPPVPSSTPLETNTTTAPQQQQQTQIQQLPLPDFNSYPHPFPWQAQNRLFAQNNTNAHRDPSNIFGATSVGGGIGGGGPEMMDFSSAFSNGDLYLWNDNDMAENFGGWIPQGGSIYSDVQFGGMGGF